MQDVISMTQAYKYHARTTKSLVNKTLQIPECLVAVVSF